MLQMHWGNGDMGDLGRRFVACFVLALHDAALPTAPDFRAAMRAYMEWAVADVLTETPDDLTGRTAMPCWSWDGPLHSQGRGLNG